MKTTAPFIANEIRLYKVADLLAYPCNAKEHPPEQIAKLAGGIAEFGFLVPVLVSADGEPIAGRGRVRAADRLGMEHVPGVPAGHLSPEQIKALILFDNRIAETGWDGDLLKDELEQLQALDSALLGLTGFDSDELDAILAGIEDDEPPVVKVPMLKFGGHKIELTKDQLKLLNAMADRHVKRAGSYAGFVEILIGE